MRLSDAEFRAMNGGLRRFLHRRVEFPALVRLGLAEGAGRDVLELGCGNGFGAELIARLRPRSYTGIDVMPEQIALAERRRLAGARFRVGDGPGEFYLAVSAFAPYKRLDLAIEACNTLRRPLKIVGRGPDERKLRTLAGPTVEFLGPRSDEEIATLYARCRALLFPGLEDFGIVPLEAMASGRPAIAYGRGGARETVIPLRMLTGPGTAAAADTGGSKTASRAPTGILFAEQTVESLVAAMEEFEANRTCFEPKALRDHALGFDRAVFKDRVASFVAERWVEHAGGRG